MRRERRQTIRVEWHSPGKIYDRDGDLLAHCLVKDLSNGGAKITGVAVRNIPKEFMLRIARGAVGMRKCHVLWKSATTIGVKFTDRLPRAREPRAQERATQERRAHERPAHERPTHERPAHERAAHERRPARVEAEVPRQVHA